MKALGRIIPQLLNSVSVFLVETIVQDSIELWKDQEWNKGKIESKNEVGMNF